MEKLSDLVLISQVVMLHNKRSFDRLVERHQSPLRRFLMNLTQGDKELADDLAQETFIKAYLSLSSFKATSGFSTWLFRIGYNVFYDYIRSRKISVDITEISETDADIIDTPESGTSMDLQEAMSHLSHPEKTCISLFYMEEQKIKDIALITGMAEGTVKSHLSRGKEKLAKHLRQNGYGN